MNCNINRPNVCKAASKQQHCQQLLISLHVTLLAISLDILRHILFLRTGNLSLITLFVQCSQSDLTPLRAPCGEAPGRDSNPGIRPLQNECCLKLYKFAYLIGGENGGEKETQHHDQQGNKCR